MKKFLGTILAVVFAVQATGMFSNEAIAAAKHKHNYVTRAQGMNDNKKHKTIRECTTCGSVSRTSTASHQKGSVVRYDKYTEKQHYIVYQCKTDGCGEHFTKTGSHDWKTLPAEDTNETYHTVTKQCEDCGQTKSELKKHSYSKGVCKCGHSKSSGVTATTKDKKGHCYTELNKWFNDNWVYSRCPSCNSSKWTIDYVETIGKTRQVWSGWRVVKHQHVICECGEPYTNKCYVDIER